MTYRHGGEGMTTWPRDRRIWMNSRLVAHWAGLIRWILVKWRITTWLGFFGRKTIKLARDLTRPKAPKWCFSKGNLLISGKSRLVKYYNLARNHGIFVGTKMMGPYQAQWKVLEKYMARSRPICLFIIWPFTNLPFGICAIYFDLKV